MANSTCWAEFQPLCKAADLLRKNIWAAVVLINLALRYPVLTDGQILEIARRFDPKIKKGQLRIGLFNLVGSSVLAKAKTKTKARPISARRLHDSRDPDEAALLEYAIVAKYPPPIASEAVGEHVYFLPPDAPAGPLVEQIRSAIFPTAPAAPAAGLFADRLHPRNLQDQWIAMAEIHLRLCEQDQQVGNGFAAISERCAAYRNVEPAVATADTIELLDHSHNTLANGLAKAPEQAVVYFDVSPLGTHVRDDIEEAKKRCSSFELWCS